jgi:sugar/nucleoside kinase (ribokinase family)
MNKMKKKYNIYGIGAALVDTELEVAETDLSFLNIEKGLMGLVDKDRQLEILSHFKNNQIKASRASGGSACNTIVAASYFGSKTFFSGKVGNDENGDFYLNDLKIAGVETPKIPNDSGSTGTCLILITPDAERSMNTFLGISANLSIREIDTEKIADSNFLYMESYLLTSESCKKAAISARKIAQQSDTKIAISLSDPGIAHHFRDALKELIGDRVDMIFCNLDEALSFSNTDNLNSAINFMKAHSKEFVVTLGENGALIFDGKKILEVKGNSVDAVDTNGAGDMFAGAFLHGLCYGMSHKLAGEFACMAAAEVVVKYGPRLKPKSHVEILDKFLRKYN